MDSFILIVVTLFFVAVIAIVAFLNVLQHHKNKRLRKILEQLEIEKNVIDTAPIVPELAKVEAYLKNDKLESLYRDWTERLDIIRNNQIPKITDMLIEADYSLSQMDYKSTNYKIAKLEMEIYKVRTNSDFLLKEIKEITTSEEKNRGLITKLKVKYRELYQKFQNTRNEYGEFAKVVNRQFENIARLFENFEKVMESNDYTEVTDIMNAIDDMLKHMEVVVEEVPAIVLLAFNILPAKMKETQEIYMRMRKNKFPVDYLNVEYNMKEAMTKVRDVLNRTRSLNLEDCLFELKVLTEYFDGLFTDFEKEKINRSMYEETNQNFTGRLDKMNVLVSDIFAQMDDIKNLYNLSKADIQLLHEVKDELKALNADYKILSTHTKNNTFAYSKLTKEIEGLILRLASIEDRLDNSLDLIGSMREDEVRARQQLEEVKLILKDSKIKIREYNLPVIPKSYYTELAEAQAAIKEIIKELEKKPITIEVLNTRVDTARDLVLKLYSRTKEMMKTAMFAEMAIVYGNRYRTSVDGLDKHLTASEILFFKGEYQKSLEVTINSLNKIEEGIYEKLLNLYGSEQS